MGAAHTMPVQYDMNPYGTSPMGAAHMGAAHQGFAAVQSSVQPYPHSTQPDMRAHAGHGGQAVFGSDPYAQQGHAEASLGRVPPTSDYSYPSPHGHMDPSMGRAGTGMAAPQGTFQHPEVQSQPRHHGGGEFRPPHRGDFRPPQQMGQPRFARPGMGPGMAPGMMHEPNPHVGAGMPPGVGGGMPPGVGGGMPPGVAGGMPPGMGGRGGMPPGGRPFFREYGSKQTALLSTHEPCC